MNESISLGLAIFGAVLIWTTSIIGGIIWLGVKFRDVEKTIYREMYKLRREYEIKYYTHNTRIQRLEIRAFGFTTTQLGPTIPDDGETFPEN